MMNDLKISKKPCHSQIQDVLSILGLLLVLTPW